VNRDPSDCYRRRPSTARWNSSYSGSRRPRRRRRRAPGPGTSY